MIHTLNGFDAASLRRCSAGTQGYFALINSMALVVLLACAWTAYRLLELVPVPAAVAVGVGLGVLALLVSMQLRWSVAGAPHSFADAKRMAGWLAHPLRRWAYLALALLMSQPVLMAAYCTGSPQSVLQAAVAQEQAEQAQQRERWQAQVQQAQAQGRQGQEAVQRLDALLQQGDAPDAVAPAVRASADQGRRKALLVGNQRYGAGVGMVDGAGQDTVVLAEALRRAGFQVATLQNATLDALEGSIQRYLASLQPGDVSVFYFAGHGFREQGVDYLMPVDFRVGQTETALSLPVAVSALSRKRVSANLIWLDASHRFARDTALQPGLAPGELGANTALVLANAPSHSAPDRKPGQAGLFASAIVRAIGQADVDTTLDALFDKVRADVGSASQGKQQIRVTSRLAAPLRLVAPDAPLAVAQRVHAANAQRARETLLQLADTWRCPVPDASGTPMQIVSVRDCVQARVTLLEDSLNLGLRCSTPAFAGAVAEDGARGLEACVDQVLAGQDGATVSATGDESPETVSSTLDLHRAVTFMRQLWLDRSLTALAATLAIVILLSGPFWCRDAIAKRLAEYETQRRYLSQAFLQHGIDELERQLRSRLAAEHAGTSRDVAAWGRALIRPLRGDGWELPLIELGDKGIAIQRHPESRG